MTNILSIKRRIQAASNVSKTTRAMQMIAASKLKKAQNSALSARTYAQKLTVLSQNLTTKIEKENFHPYMIQSKDSKKSLIIVIAPDRGLCGALLTNLMKEFLNVQKTYDAEFTYVIVGKKVESKIAYLKGGEILASFPLGGTTPTFDMVYPISRIIDEYFLGDKIDSVKILYSQFVSIFTQAPRVETILPIAISDVQQEEKNKSLTYVFEPDLPLLLPPLLKHYLEMTLYRYLLESYICEQASRMIAMQNATDNAKDIILELRLEYNKERQAKITNEILDITNTGVPKFDE